MRKNFFVDLKVPARLTQGDKPRFSAEVHHRGVTGTLALRLTIYAGGPRRRRSRRRSSVKGDGVDEVLFDPFEVPDGDSVRLTLTATLGEAKDELIVEVPIRPWGVQVFASASGTGSDDTTVFVGLPPGRRYESPEMLIVISPTVRRMLIELALGEDAYRIEGRSNDLHPACRPTPWPTAPPTCWRPARRRPISQSIRATATPEAQRLTDRIHGLVAELVSLQNEDGGWPWVRRHETVSARPSDRMTSARVVWALASAEPLGLLTDATVLDQAATWLTQEFAKLEGGDHETRAALLHALSTRHKATFEQANSLNRVRQGLSERRPSPTWR